jgi:hypothetical protein
VRSISCKVIGEIALSSDLKQLDKSILESVEERTKDKKVKNKRKMRVLLKLNLLKTERCEGSSYEDDRICI